MRLKICTLIWQAKKVTLNLKNFFLQNKIKVKECELVQGIVLSIERHCGGVHVHWVSCAWWVARGLWWLASFVIWWRRGQRIAQIQKKLNCNLFLLMLLIVIIHQRDSAISRGHFKGRVPGIVKFVVSLVFVLCFGFWRRTGTLSVEVIVASSRLWSSAFSAVRQLELSIVKFSQLRRAFSFEVC